MAPIGPKLAYIYRITHIDNVPWILDNGLHCVNSNVQDPNYVAIGLNDLIIKRKTRIVDKGTGGLLSDYIPFYFTPKSIMMYHIHTGFNGVQMRRNEEIVIFTASLYHLRDKGHRVVFTKANAYSLGIDFYDDLKDLDQVDWELLRGGDFKNDPENPKKSGRFHAEALIHHSIPIGDIAGIACYHNIAQGRVAKEVASRNLTIPVKTYPDWYF